VQGHRKERDGTVGAKREGKDTEKEEVCFINFSVRLEHICHNERILACNIAKLNFVSKLNTS
jgi:hypothetical protein